jgi:hypothetical protein
MKLLFSVSCRGILSVLNVCLGCDNTVQIRAISDRYQARITGRLPRYIFFLVLSLQEKWSIETSESFVSRLRKDRLVAHVTYIQYLNVKIPE